MGRLLALVLSAAVLAGGCGSGESGDSKDGADNDTAPEVVIRGWSDALRSGDVDKAAGYFALPSTVQNGTPPVRLRTRNAVRNFNVALPCGAKLVKTATSDRFTTATFRLTARGGPGGNDCAGGAGDIARTTFVIKNGKIAQWRRVANTPRPSGPVV